MHKTSLKKHITAIHESTKEKCELCGNEFSNIDSHMKRVHQKKILGENCSICNKYLADKGQLTRHFEALHKTIKDYECDICEEKFTAKRHLDRHKEKLHNINKVKYPCNECGKEFLEPRDLKRHVSFIHLKTKMYQCETCEKRFATRVSVRNHVRGTHDGIKDHICNITFVIKHFLKKDS